MRPFSHPTSPCSPAVSAFIGLATQENFFLMSSTI